jgi:hypothetical protein
MELSPVIKKAYIGDIGKSKDDSCADMRECITLPGIKFTRRIQNSLWEVDFNFKNSGRILRSF